MTIMIPPEQTGKTVELLARILSYCKSGDDVQFLTEPATAEAVVQRLRVALSRSRKRNIERGKLNEEFTLRHSIYPYTDLTGKRHECIVMSMIQTHFHVGRMMLDDLMER